MPRSIAQPIPRRVPAEPIADERYRKKIPQACAPRERPARDMTARHAHPSTHRIVLVEDSPDDAELIGFALRNAPFSFFIERVETREEFVAKLEVDTPDV